MTVGEIVEALKDMPEDQEAFVLQIDSDDLECFLPILGVGSTSGVLVIRAGEEVDIE